jgi:hypothetical protein
MICQHKQARRIRFFHVRTTGAIFGFNPARIGETVQGCPLGLLYLLSTVVFPSEPERDVDQGDQRGHFH